MPLGLLAGRLNRNGLTAASGCGLIALAHFLPLPLAAAVTAGVGNALFHLGGGMDVLNGCGKRAAALGVFVSPGALGLYLGTRWSGKAPLGLAPVGLLVLAAALLRRRPSKNVPLDVTLSGGWGPLVLLVLVVVLRSYMGIQQSFPWRSGGWALALLLAAVLGKAAGGFAMDRLGPRRAAAWSLGGAAALYLCAALPLPGTLAAFLFNMTMPVTLWAAAQRVPGAKGFAFGLLTFGLFLGWLPAYLGWPNLLSTPWACAALSLISLALLWPALKEERC